MATSAAWRPIGTVLVESGAITEEDLFAALAEQRRSGRRLGELLIDSGVITWLQLAHAIAEQAIDLEATAASHRTPEPEVAEPEEVPQPVVEVVEPAPVVEVVAPEPTPVVAPEPPPVVAVVEPVVEIAPPPPPPPAPVAEPPLSVPPVSSPAPPSDSRTQMTNDEASRLETVEAMLKERQRAFLELVSVTERLRATVARLQDELSARDSEIARLRGTAIAS